MAEKLKKNHANSGAKLTFSGDHFHSDFLHVGRKEVGGLMMTVHHPNHPLDVHYRGSVLVCMPEREKENVHLHKDRLRLEF